MESSAEEVLHKTKPVDACLEGTMIICLPSHTIGSCSSEPGFAFGLRGLGSKMPFPYILLAVVSSQHGNLLLTLFSGFAREGGHVPIISSIVERLSDVIAGRDHL